MLSVKSNNRLLYSNSNKYEVKYRSKDLRNNILKNTFLSVLLNSTETWTKKIETKKCGL